MYEGPAGIVLTRDETYIVWSHLVHVNNDSVRAIRDRMHRYLSSDWQERSEQRARAIERCNPQTRNPS